MSQPARWLAIYADDAGNSRATMLAVSDPTSLPFGFDGLCDRLADCNPGATITLVEMPTDACFHPMIVDWSADDEAPLNFVDI